MGGNKKRFLYLMGVLYAGAGINHFWHPETYLMIIPSFLPFPKMLNYLTGALEVGLALLLFVPFCRNAAAWGIIVLLVLVFPANIQMVMNYMAGDHPYLWAAWLRLPLQLLLIWWALTYTKVYSSCQFR